MKKLKLFAVTAVLSLSMTVGFTAQAQTTKKTTAASMTSTKKLKGLVKQKGYYYYYWKGKTLKNRWKKISGRWYYFDKAGRALTGSVKINGIRYIFSEKGRLIKPSKNRNVLINGVTYCVRQGGGAKRGWVIVRNKLYYSKGTGAIVKSDVRNGIALGADGVAEDSAASRARKRSLNGENGWILEDDTLFYAKKDGGLLVSTVKNGITLTESGAAEESAAVTAQKRALDGERGWIQVESTLFYADDSGNIVANEIHDGVILTESAAAESDSTATQLKLLTRSIVSQITNDSMTQSQKLYACWNYVVSGRIRYVGKYPNLNQAGWQRSMALNVLQTGYGNCYGFACAFSALAYEVGYSPKLVCGRVTGRRDGAADGLTRHCWVLINGAYYDPEAQYEGWCKGIYGYGYYPVYHTIQQIVDF